MFLADYHVHSNCSQDGSSPMEEIAERAASLAFSEVAISDHCDMGCAFDDKNHRSELTRVRERYKEGPKLLYAVELGDPHHDIGEAMGYLERNDYDFVLGSLHRLRSGEDFYCLSYTSAEQCEELLGRYVEELFDMVRLGGFDVLAHLTYPLRYMQGVQGATLDCAENRVRELFALMVQKGVGLELNVSGLRSGRQALPDVKWMRLFREAGGEVVTVGSDAHSARDVGGYIREGLAVLKEAGFSYVSAFSERRPRFEKIL